MSKLVINDITSGYASTTALNTAFAAIETALENTLSRDGTSPNQMQANIDLNGYAILNARATSGNENFIWMGTWTTGTVYAVNNLVYAPEGNNLGNTLICISTHTAGATLDGDIAKWAVFAQRGATGMGTGDVAGPASATSDSLARFNGTTGKLLKDGAVIGVDVQAYSANLATLSTLSTGTSSGNIPLVGDESATDTIPGLVRKSTTAENAAGTGTGVVAAADLPAAVAASFSGTNQSTAANGYQKLPGGIIIQWGTSAAIGATSNAVQTFPIAFPNGLLSVSSVPLNAGSTHYISGISTTQFTLYNTSGAVSAFGWIAIGH